MKANLILDFRGFTLDEYVKSMTAEKNGIVNQYNIPLKVASNLYNLDRYLVSILKMLHPSLIINSGYRCDEVNKMVNGSANSQHLYGYAADLYCNDLDLLYDDILLLIYDQVIRYDNFIHVSYVDYRKNRKQKLDYRKKGGVKK